jgi:hypothetical protein
MASLSYTIRRHCTSQGAAADESRRDAGALAEVGAEGGGQHVRSTKVMSLPLVMK